MRQHQSNRRHAFIVALLCLGATVSHAAPQDASALQRMCQGADKVRALSVMCHSYLNGYLDTVALYEKGRLPFCLADNDKERMPAELVSWLRLHPDLSKDPAPQVLKKALSERFPCKSRR
jgi:hypothetical protein